MNSRQALSLALRRIRKARNLTQEDFSIVSSRTYLSALERGLKSPTLDKIEEIAEVMRIPPASLILVTYAIADEGDANKAIEEIVLAAKTILSLP